MNATVEAFEHANVMGKKQKYIRIKNEKGELLMNIGESSFKKAKEMTEEEPAEKAKVEEQKEGGKKIGEEEAIELERRMAVNKRR